MSLRNIAMAGAGMALAAAFVLAAPRPAPAQTFPSPSDEAALYAGAKKEGTLVWYGGSPPEPMRAMADDFQAKYPGVKVEIIRIVGVAQYQRFMQESQAKQYIADVLHIGDPPSMAQLVEDGYTADWKIPTYDQMPEDARLKVNAYTAWVNDTNIAYNPNHVTPEEVKLFEHDWRGLLDPRFKGRLNITDQACGTCMATLQMFLSPKYKDRFGEPFLKALAAQQPKIYGDVVVPVDRVIAGEQDIYILSGEGTNTSQWRAGAPLRWVHPSPTPAYGNTWFAIPKTAPHPYSARLFVNWMFSEEGAKSIQSKYGGQNMLKSVPDARPVTKESWYVPITERYIPDWKAWAVSSDKDWAAFVKLLRAAQ